jgi:hypothetical protein
MSRPMARTGILRYCRAKVEVRAGRGNIEVTGTYTIALDISFWFYPINIGLGYAGYEYRARGGDVNLQ